MLDVACVVCDARSLECIEEYRLLPRVTSDSKPWPAGGTLACCTSCGAIQKPADEVWLGEIEQIYGAYDIFHISGGAEQRIFSANGEPRSKLLTQKVVEERRLPERGRLIDIGCGNGAALLNFSRALPAWQLYGAELSDKLLPELHRQPNFVKLFLGDLTAIDERFTLVTMIHALEHMLDPVRTIREALGLLEESGTLLIEIPDAETSPFDLLVADHRMHLTTATLGALAARAGLAVSTLTNTFLPKELTLLGGRGRVAAVVPDPAAGMQLARRTVRWLGEVMRAASALAEHAPFGLFGTAIAGMALYGVLRDRVVFFVDEDPSRAGRSFDGKPILAPADVPRDATVFVALPPETAARVSARLSHGTTRFIPPDALVPR